MNNQKRRLKLDKFNEVFQFLDEYGGTSFIADINKENYDEERYKNIINLKTKAYDEFWKKIFFKIEPYLKDKNKKQLDKIQNWQNSGNIYNYFWIQIKDKDKLDYASSISIVVAEDKVFIKIEYKFTSKNNINPLANHNKYILSIDQWRERYNLNLEKYFLDYECQSGREKLNLNDFIENHDLRSKIEEKIKNGDNFRIVIQKEFDKDYVLSCNNFELEIAQSINEIDFLYEKAVENNYILENTPNQFIDTIKKQKMSKSYKIALLSAFIDNEGMKKKDGSHQDRAFDTHIFRGDPVRQNGDSGCQPLD